MSLSCADALLQSHSDGESQRSNMEREDTRSSPSTPSTPSVCSPTSTTSSVPSTGKNVCASCGQEILDRYLLKVRDRPHTLRLKQAQTGQTLGASCLFVYSFFNADINIERQQIAYLHKRSRAEKEGAMLTLVLFWFGLYWIEQKAWTEL